VFVERTPGRLSRRPEEAEVKLLIEMDGLAMVIHTDAAKPEPARYE
jgi:hypothetical protein